MTALRLKRGTTTQNNNYTGPPGELTVDTTSNQLRLHNGTTVGGVAIGDLTVTSVKTSAYNANVNELVRIDSTTGEFTITLPATPIDGARISFVDVGGQCGTNPVLVAANGKTILGDSTGISLDANGAVLGLVFNNLTNNWSKINMFSSSSFAVVDPAQNVTYVDDVFSAYTYTGNGSTQTINNGVDLAGSGGLVWIKNRTSTGYNHLMDSARGITKYLYSDLNSSQDTISSIVTSLNSNGISLGTANQTNTNGTNFVSWTFRKAPKFFDIVTYTGNDAARTITHNLGQVPGMIIVKCSSTAGSWFVYHRTLANTEFLKLETTNAKDSLSTLWNSTTPTSTEFSIGTSNAVNAGSNTYVAYLFAHDTSANGMIQCGSFTSDGSGQSNSVTLGWEPQYIMYKNSSSTGSWIVIDSARGMPVGDGANTKMLNPNSSNAEGVTYSGVTLTATGFSIAGLSGSATYIYMAIRRPNKPPTLGTQVYNAIARTGTGAAATVTGVGFAPDLVLINNTNHVVSNQNMISDRLRGIKQLQTNQTGADAEYSRTEEITSFNNLGVTFGTSTWATSNYSGASYINYFFRRAPGVFDIVCYTGNGSTLNVNHNLGVAPEIIIMKARNQGTLRWQVWCKYNSLLAGTANTDSCTLILNSSACNGQTYSESQELISLPTSSYFTVGDYGDFSTPYMYVVYLFATKAGISKVGSYTGNGANQTINCGFTTGARFVLIKRTDSTGDWYVWDSVRGIVTGNDPCMVLNDYTKDNNSPNDSIDPDNSGFIVNQVAATNINVNAGTYIFLAFA
jgi:hypothetical protein